MKFSVAVMATLVLAPLSSASAAQEGGGSIAPPPENWSIAGGNVDLRTGSYVYSQTDLSLGGAGGLSLDRIVSTGLKGYQDAFGSFAHNWDIFATYKQHYSGDMGNPDISDRLMIWRGGRPETFEHMGPAGTQSYVEISRASGGRITAYSPLQYTAADGTVITFGNGGCTFDYGTCHYASQVQNPDGTRITLSYDTAPSGTQNSKRLRRITSNRGYTIVLEYTAQNARNVIRKACIYNLAVAAAPSNNICDTAAARTTSYTYTYFNNRVRMTSATDASGKVWQFSHVMSGENVVQGFRRPGESVDWLTNTIANEKTPIYGENGAVIRQDHPDGSFFNYTYFLMPQSAHGENQIEPRPITGGRYTDANGTAFSATHEFPLVPLQWNEALSGPTPWVWVNELQYQMTPGPAWVTASNGQTITNDYCDRVALQTYPDECYVTWLQKQTDPEGNWREYYYLGRPKRVTRVEHHPKPNSTEAVRVETAVYGCSAAPCKASPTRITDAKGAQTDYTYDLTHGGVLTKTAPADASGVRPQTRYTYAQRHARDASGAALSPPVWVLASESYCRTSSASGNGCAAGASDQVVTVYDYGPTSGPNNLWLRGTAVTADGQTLRTCFGYDAFGQKISETQPKGNAGSCS
ncbi:hypothetical protein HME9302_00094 [Alteripontixanthobacter maritimus]|uniref:YD repeat-containing protein n=1 Tax=Alteripontixanthobacter maritimus TaxID=2161824 RepID=A0A369Q9F7_9SPHN|nr:hypothetical protein [Alteripontixanthobacter maritimus]RDC58918.1 hypothetical protein HME9302_00094 [Alteripontixanthobacter maritimus]